MNTYPKNFLIILLFIIHQLKKHIEKNVGYVHLISHKLEGTKQIERQVDYIEKYIAQCEKDGYKKGDICILNNNNAPLNSWGIELLKRNILVVSNDSLFITNEPKVLLFISYLKRRVNQKTSLRQNILLTYL